MLPLARSLIEFLERAFFLNPLRTGSQRKTSCLLALEDVSNFFRIDKKEHGTPSCPNRVNLCSGEDHQTSRRISLPGTRVRPTMEQYSAGQVSG